VVQIFKIAILAVVCCALLGGCRSRSAEAGPSVEFTRVPLAEKGGTSEIDTIEGRVVGAQPGQHIVLYARSGAWYVQPYADQPLTEIQPNSRWRNSTHLGTEYAALLVEAEYLPPARSDVLPNRGGGVVALATVMGEPPFWQTWWFRCLVGLACVFALVAFFRLRLRRLTNQLNVRFEERLAERMRIAQELHDTLLQGFLSASMQLHVAVERLPEDSPARQPLNHVQQLMGQVIEEGRNAVQGLRSNASESLQLEQAFSRVQQELALQEQIAFRVIVEGRPRPLHPLIRDEVYRIGREALVNAFRHSRAKSIEVEVEYVTNHLRVMVSDDGCGIASPVLRAGREGHWGLSGMHERAERIGARLKVRSRPAAGTEVELSIPGHVAFTTEFAGSSPGWFARLRRAKAKRGELKRPESEEDE
jgi:signal transduction histidine kinase